MPPGRITLQHLKPDTSNDPIQQRDARIAGTGISLPPNVLLDFMYGVAAYRRWGGGGGGEVHTMMQQRFDDRYRSNSIPTVSTAHPSGDDESSPESRGSDDDYDSDQEINDKPDMSDGMLSAMDSILMLSKLLKRTTPQSKAPERQKREEEEELRAKEANQLKVQQWRQNAPCVLFYLPNYFPLDSGRTEDNEFQSNASCTTT